MQVFPTIYKRDSKGNVRVWHMEVDGNKYRTVAGIMDGQLVVSEWTVAEAKNVGRSNATTPEEQALSEVKSHYTKKLDIDYHEKIEDIDTPKIFEPMLAKKWEDRASKIKYNTNVYVQPKLDGIRCILNRYGAFTRYGNEIVAIPHIIELFKPVFEQYPDAIFDGELYNHELKHDFNAIVSMIKKTKLKPEDLELSARMAQYHVYDFPGLMHEPFSVRMEKAFELILLGGFNMEPVVQTVKTIKVESQSEIDDAYGSFIEDGYEGGIIRLEGPYEQKRSNNLIKRKDFDDDEFEIVEVLEGTGNWSGCAKKIVVKTKEGRICEASVQGSMDYCRHVLNNAANYIGKQATVRFFGYTPDGALRFGVAKALHEDKRW